MSDSSKNWWSRSKSGSPQKSAGISLNSIASAIGLKSKKQGPSLVIQDPPSSSTPDRRPSPARSRVDSIGPPTPVNYESQTSDNDPFAARQNIPPVPQIPSQKTFNDINSGTSSSLSTKHACDPTLSPTTRKLTNKRSINDIPFSRSLGYTDRTPSLSSKRPSSSSTVVANGQIHVTLPMPKLRARGMTDGGSTRKAGFFSDEPLPSKKLSKKSSISTFSTAISSTEHTSPQVVIQQASQNRLTAPPCAPPAHSLPATPHCPMGNQIARTEYGSPSCMHFASSSSDNMLPALCNPLRETRYSQRNGFFSHDHHPEFYSPAQRESKTAPGSPRKLKKAISHHSFSGKINVQSSTLPKLSPEKRIDHLVPNPVSPPSPVHSTKFPSLLALDTKVASERSASGSYSLGRKKIFSHSNTTTRPSTSHNTPTTSMMEDDSLSVLSIRSDHSSRLVPLKPWATLKANPQSSFWDEAGSPVSSSSARSTSEYIPQPILSAAEVAKLEASVTNSPDRFNRSRTFSHLSASTTASDRENSVFTSVGLSPPPITKSRGKPGSMKSVTSKTSGFFSPSSSRARSPTRSPPPSINGNGNPGNDSSRSTIMFQPFSSPQSPAESMTSLPPPPRPRQRSHLTCPLEHSNSAPSFSSSVAKPSRSKSTTEKGIHRRSIMKKPSFLEIDDDDTDPDSDFFSAEAATESFLDLARESFASSHSS